MNKNSNENIILEEYENSFIFKKRKSNLNIEFNRVAFIFFFFFSDIDNLLNTAASSWLIKINH